MYINLYGIVPDASVDHCGSPTRSRSAFPETSTGGFAKDTEGILCIVDSR